MLVFLGKRGRVHTKGVIIGHATARFLEGFLEGSLSNSKCFLEGFLEGACKDFQ